MVWLPVRLLERRPAVRQIYRRRYQYLLVDEFQDSNVIQNRLIRCLLNASQNLCVVGDDDQSIYAFRGARRELILQFPSEYRRTCVMKLTANYRCSRQIVGVANAVIKDSRQKRFRKRLVAAKAPCGPVLFVQTPDESSAREFVLRDISFRRREGRRYDEMAVLVRVQADLQSMRQELAECNIPCNQETGVNVMTLHAAKGLEFPVVYLPGLSEGTLPHWNATKAGDDAIEEERRLFYVGVTRAAERLTLISSARRGSYACQPSRFLQPLLRRRLVDRVELST